MPRHAVMSDGDKINFEVFGEAGPFVYMGPQLFLTPMLPNAAPIVRAYIDALVDRYRIIVADWPRGVGASAAAKGPSMISSNVVDDLLRIADAAGAERFAWWGYSFGGAAGLQLAAHSDRISALACGGYPPLWQPVSDMLAAVRRMAASQTVLAPLVDGPLPQIDAEIHKQNIAFYVSVSGQDEMDLLTRIRCPRLVFHDLNDALELGGLRHDFAMRTRAAEAELRRMGWDVEWMDTGKGHFAMEDVPKCLAAFVPFLDRALLAG